MHLRNVGGFPVTSGVEAHCRRTSAVAGLIASALSLRRAEKELLCLACLAHHRATGLLRPDSLRRLLGEMIGDVAATTVAADPVALSVRAVLGACERPVSGGPAERKLAGILRLADAFDQEMEAQPIETIGARAAIGRLRGGVEGGLWPAEAFEALERLPPATPAGPDASWPVPVFPAAAVRILGRMRDSRASMAEMVDAAGLDPAIAGKVMQLANSALFGPRQRVSTLAQAIARLGLATSEKVITAAALKPVFASSDPRLRDAWRHALHVADLAEQLAAATGKLDPGEAYLGGLVHDVGRIALVAAFPDRAVAMQELATAGCPAAYAESLLLGADHAAIGARIASEWRLPPAMATAIAQHHSPESADAPFADCLYLAEELSGAEEDLPSVVRLELSLHRTGLSWERISKCAVSELGHHLAAA